MPISAAGGKQAPSTVLVPVAVDGDVGGTLRAQATSLADWHGRPPRIIAGTQHILGPPGSWNTRALRASANDSRTAPGLWLGARAMGAASGNERRTMESVVGGRTTAANIKVPGYLIVASSANTQWRHTADHVTQDAQSTSTIRVPPSTRSH